MHVAFCSQSRLHLASIRFRDWTEKSMIWDNDWWFRLTRKGAICDPQRLESRNTLGQMVVVGENVFGATRVG